MSLLFPLGDGRGSLNEEWTADRAFRGMRLPYGAAGRALDELKLCPHCARTYFRSNGGSCPRCGGPVPLEAPTAVVIHPGLG